jgi:hypothetical protein
VKKRLRIVVAVILCVAGSLGIYRLVTSTSIGVALTGDVVPSSTLIDNLSSDDPDLVMTSLNVLQNRADPSGQKQARKLLSSSNDYIWFNAALYLGAINDQQAVPYLIKGLKHPAYRSYPDVVRELQAITSQTFGMDQAKWIEWWGQQNPRSTFSFTYAALEQQSGQIQTGSNILINHVIDATDVSYLGSPIRLLGVRLKANVNAAQGERLLETAILGQFAEIERDGDKLTADGAVPAMIFWVPDTMNDPSMAASLRQGLPPVPFARRTSVQGYLLKSGFYEMDLSGIQDQRIVVELQALNSTTRPVALGNDTATKP